MRKIILNSQHPLLILPRQTSFNRVGAKYGDQARQAASPGMSGFWPWCAICNKKVPYIAKVDAGSKRTVWLARCHGDEQAIEIRAASSRLEPSRLDARVKFLTFFAPEAAYGASNAVAKDA